MTSHLLEFVYMLNGRDAGKCFIVVSSEDNLLYVCNGKNRKVATPKRKNPKHLHFTGVRDEELFKKLSDGLGITNKEVRKSVRRYQEDIQEL